MTPPAYFLDFDISIRTINGKKIKHYVIVIDGEDLAYYQCDDYSADGWYSYIRIRYSDTDVQVEDLRRAANALAYFKGQILKRVRDVGHFTFGNFDTKKYIL